MGIFQSIFPLHKALDVAFYISNHKEYDLVWMRILNKVAGRLGLLILSRKMINRADCHQFERRLFQQPASIYICSRGTQMLAHA